MIDRNDMLELTRRLTPARSSVDRIAGAWFDEEGYVEGTFNKNILHLKLSELKKNLELAKTVLFSKTNDQLKDYRISASSRKPGGLWQLLDGMKGSGLKNDALADLFYELLGERFLNGAPSYCFLFHGSYDVPVKGLDGEWLEGSEEVYEYVICVMGPALDGYEPGVPEYGFLYPAFRERTTGWDFINIYEKTPGKGNQITKWLLAG